MEDADGDDVAPTEAMMGKGACERERGGDIKRRMRGADDSRRMRGEGLTTIARVTDSQRESGKR